MLRQKTRKAFTFSVGLGGADKLVGGALGMFKGALIVSLLAMLLKLWGPPTEFRDQIYSSKLYKPMLKIAPAVYNVVKRFIPNSNPFDVELQKNVNKVNSYERTDKAQEFINELQDNN
jgi:uncharacterized membrane protein required for colicin V production